MLVTNNRLAGMNTDVKKKTFQNLGLIDTSFILKTFICPVSIQENWTIDNYS